MQAIIDENDSLIPMTAKSEVGLPRDVILSLVASGDIELIVMGTNGSSGVSEVFVGSNTERIVRDSKIPVISVHADTDFELKDHCFCF